MTANPTPSEITAALAALEAAILADVKALEAKLPSEAQASIEQIAAIVKTALDNFNWAAFRETIAAELVQLVLTGRSQAPHDPTEVV